MFGLVWTPDELGLGRVVAVDAGTAQVQFMHSLSRLEERAYPVRDLRRAQLEPQTRVSVKNSGRLYVGRVAHGQMQADGLYVYQVQFPNEVAAPVPERFVKVRCLAPAGDPADALVSIGIDSQFIHDRRTRILEHVVRGRAGSRSYAGMLSASVELYPHQLEVVRRVTEDALQRYLLADEVGLGKTIEAGAIIRQHLLEIPDADVLVLAPDHLVGQWQTELHARFHLDDFGTRVQVLRHGVLPSTTNIPSLLVVDEVHQLVSRGVPEHYDQLSRVARAAPRLLLLSATPVMDDDLATLRLFHLLDPDTYRLEDAAAFADRIARRQEIGRLLLVLASDSDPFVMSRAVSIGRRVLPDDQEAQALLDQLEAVLESEDPSAVRRERARLREYLADTYQLSKRMLRSRRRDLATKGMFGRTGPMVVEALSDDAASIAEALDDWRLECAAHLFRLGLGTPDGRRPAEADDARRTALLVFRDLLDSIALGSARVEASVAARLANLQRAPLFADEDHLLRRIGSRSKQAGPDVESWSRLIHDEVRNFTNPRHPARLVVFTTSTETAKAIDSRLPRLLGYGANFLLTGEMDPRDVHALLWEFEHHRSSAVLVADQAGEDGLNLQFADAVAHLDLPMSVMRVEQRLGRVDRIGRGSRPIRQFVVIPTDDRASPWLAWHTALVEGFRVFSESVADLQFRALSLEEEVFESILLKGTIDEDALRVLREAIAAERRRLDERYALDADELFNEDASQDLLEVSAIDAEDETLAKAMSAWWEQTLGLIRDDADDRAFVLQWDSTTKLPERLWRSRIQPCLGRSLTYHRSVAVADLASRIVRTGAPLVDAIPDLLRYDDRGTAFATWRVVPEFRATEEEWIVFRCVFVIEVDVAAARQERADSIDPALRRRVDRLAPPWVEVLYLDNDFRRIKRPDLLTVLAKPYTAADTNLGSRPEVLQRILPPDRYEGLVRGAAAAAEEMLLASVAYQQRRLSALDRADRDIATARSKLERMQNGSRLLGEAHVGLEEDVRRLDEERQLLERLQPRLESMGMIILAGRPPA